MTTLFVAHGALGSAAQMQPIADALQTLEGVVVELVEFPGHGVTPLPNGQHFGFALFADVMKRAVSNGRDPLPMLLGYSMGGYVGLSVESQSPGTFSGIVTFGTKFDWTPESAEKEAARLDPAVITRKVPRFAEALAARHRHAGGWETVLARTTQLMHDSGRDPFLTPERFARIAAPVSVVVGSIDDVVSVQESEHTASLMPHASCEVLPDVGHPIERVPIATLVRLVNELRARV